MVIIKKVERRSHKSQTIFAQKPTMQNHKTEEIFLASS